MLHRLWLVLWLAWLLAQIGAASPSLVLDTSNDTATLKRFRAVDSLYVSGSAQFTEATLRDLKQKLAGHRVTVVDLRQESHGFLNDIPVEWLGPNNHANLGKSTEQVTDQERQALHDLRGQVLSLRPKGPGMQRQVVKVERAQTEAELVASQGFSYLRLATPDHCRPDDATVDRFVSFVRTLPDDAWLHFHCAGGWGRTTTFMAMYDLLKNRRSLTCDEILRWQYLLGGEDLTIIPPASSFNHQPAVERLAFLRRFYQYCQHNHDGFRTSWSALRSRTASAHRDQDLPRRHNSL